MSILYQKSKEVLLLHSSWNILRNKDGGVSAVIRTLASIDHSVVSNGGHPHGDISRKRLSTYSCCIPPTVDHLKEIKKYFTPGRKVLIMEDVRREQLCSILFEKDNLLLPATDIDETYLLTMAAEIVCEIILTQPEYKVEHYRYFGLPMYDIFDQDGNIVWQLYVDQIDAETDCSDVLAAYFQTIDKLTKMDGLCLEGGDK